MLLVDAAPLVALRDPSDPLQQGVERILRAERPVPVIPAPVCAEVDYLLRTRYGPAEQRYFIEDLAAGRFQTPGLDSSDWRVAQRVDTRYRDLNLGLADLSLIVLAHRFKTLRILTFDQRHFRAVETIGGGTFKLLPYDEDV
jgi:uncharacterized protein